jgi:2-phosphoglycerate kinase
MPNKTNKIILILGAPVSGKSTIAYDLGIELGIKQVIDTDIIRGVKITQEPNNRYINTYSFKSWQNIGNKTKQNILIGYEKYSSQISKELAGLIEINDNLQRNIIIEGVHLHPSLLKDLLNKENIYPICLSVTKEEHKRNITNRLKEGHKQIYLNNFNTLRAINNYLVEYSRKNKIPVIQNIKIKKTLRLIKEKIEANEDE